MDSFVVKHNERLSTVINKLKNHLISADNVLAANYSSDPEIDDNLSKKMDKLNKEDISEQLDLPDNEKSPSWKSQEDKSLSKSYLMWENNSNLCWLDSSMSLLAHNKSLSRLVNDNSSQISKILEGYESAISVFNDYSNQSLVEARLQKAKNMLHKVQETTLDYLKPILKYKEGEPDSAFCSLLNLISENEQIKNLFCVEFFWLMNCAKCAVPRFENKKKTIITLSKLKEFNPSSPVSLYKCRFCESTDQEREIKFKTLPGCLIFHFENGAGEGELDSLDFELNDRKYKLSGLITLEKSRDLTVNHYVTWIRDTASDSWLECNDLNNDILSYGVVPPLINLKDICIILYEALDERGTIPNITMDIDGAIDMGADDPSSDIPVIELSDEEEGTKSNQPNQVDTDETDSDSDENLSKRLNEFLSDSVFIKKNTVTREIGYFDPSSEENDTSSKKENLSRENSEFDKSSLQQKVLSVTDKKSDDQLKIEVSSDSFITNSVSDRKNGLEVFAEVNINEFLVKDNIEMPSKDENKSYISDSNVKISKEISDKPLNGALSNIEQSVMSIDMKDIVSGKRNISSETAECLFQKNDTVVLNMHPFKNQDNKNAECPLKIPIEHQNNQLGSNGLVEILGSNINGNEDCTGESCARTSGLPLYHRAKKKWALKTDLAVKKFKSFENKKITKDSAVGFPIPCTSHYAERTVLIPTFPSLAFHTSDTEKHLQKSDITRLSTFPETMTNIPIKNTNSLFVLEDMPIVTSEAEIQNIDTKLLVKSCIKGKNDSKDSPTEINKEHEFRTSELNDNSNDLLTPLNPMDEKSSVYYFEDKTHTSGDLVTTHTDNSVKKVLVDDDISFNKKQNKVDSKSLERIVPIVEKENPISSMLQTKIQNNKPLRQLEENPASFKNVNEHPNVKPVDNQEIAEDISLKKIASQRLIELKAKHSECDIEGNNLSSKRPVVHITRLKNTEILNYVSGKVAYAEDKSLEELTKTVVVKIEKTDPDSILKRKDEQAGSSQVTKVENNSIRKSSRIHARQMKQAEKAKKLSLITSLDKKNNSQAKSANISTERKLGALPEIVDFTLETEDLLQKTSRTRTCPEVHNKVISPNRTKKKHSEDTNENVKSKRQRTKSIKVNDSAIQSHPPAALLLETASSTEIIHNEMDSSSKTLSTNEYCTTSTHKNDFMTGQEVANTDNYIQLDNNVLELQAKCTTNCECNDLQLYELIENSCNCVIANVFEFFHFK